MPSFSAADKLKTTGRGGKRRLAVYLGLRQHQGATSAELAKAMDVDRYEPSRRLPELARAGWVCRGPRRRCRVSGILSTTWYITRGWSPGRKPRPEAPVPKREPEKTKKREEDGKCHRLLTPEERRELRHRLAETGDRATRAFLGGLNPPPEETDR